MNIENNRRVRNRRNSFIPTSVKGVRAEETFWKKCDKKAREERTTRNELIVRIVSKYCDKRASNDRE